MDQGVQFLDIILFALIAIFLGLRLRSMLGRRTGQERRRDPFAARKTEEASEGKVIPLPDRGAQAAGAEATEASPGGADADVQAGFEGIAAADRGFSPAAFLAGARAAFEIVVNAFGAGDAGALRPLLSDEVFDNFNRAIQARAKAGHTRQTTLVGIASASVVEAELRDRSARLTVKFVSDQINATLDGAGNAVEGDSAKVATVTDLWTFERSLRSRDPNWTLVATGSSN